MGWIPKQIHYIWLGVDKKYIPETILETVRNFAVLNPDWSINIWSDHPMKIMKTYERMDLSFSWSFRHVDSVFDKGIDNHILLQSAFYREKQGQLANHAAAADILRTIILLREGGIYSDLDVQCLKKLPDFFAANGMLLPALSESGDVTNALMAALPNNVVFREALREIVHCYFESPLFSEASWQEKRELPMSKRTTFAPRRTLTITMTGPDMLERVLTSKVYPARLIMTDSSYFLDPSCEMPTGCFKIHYAKSWLRTSLRQSRRISVLNS